MRSNIDSVSSPKDVAREASSLFNAPPADRRRILNEWHAYHRAKGVIYRNLQARAAKNARLFGWATAVLSAIVGTSIFATIESNPATGWKVAVGLVSLTGAVLAATQSSLDFSGQEARYRAAAEAFGPLRRTLQRWALDSANNPTDRDLKDFQEAWDSAEKDSPAVPDRNFRNALEKAKAEEDKHPTF